MNYFFTFFLMSALCMQAEQPQDYKRYSVNEYAHKIAEQFSALAQNT